MIAEEIGVGDDLLIQFVHLILKVFRNFFVVIYGALELLGVLFLIKLLVEILNIIVESIQFLFDFDIHEVLL